MDKKIKKAKLYDMVKKEKALAKTGWLIGPITQRKRHAYKRIRNAYKKELKETLGW